MSDYLSVHSGILKTNDLNGGAEDTATSLLQHKRDSNPEDAKLNLDLIQSQEYSQQKHHHHSSSIQSIQGVDGQGISKAIFNQISTKQNGLKKQQVQSVKNKQIHKKLNVNKTYDMAELAKKVNQLQRETLSMRVSEPMFLYQQAKRPHITPARIVQAAPTQPQHYPLNAFVGNISSASINTSTAFVKQQNPLQLPTSQKSVHFNTFYTKPSSSQYSKLVKRTVMPQAGQKDMTFDNQKFLNAVEMREWDAGVVQSGKKQSKK